jgi:Fe-S cluster biogenesis protein NfuA
MAEATRAEATMAETDGTETDGTETGRLDDEAVAQRLAWLEDVLGRLEQMPGPAAQTAMDAVSALTEVYGEALARVMDTVGDGPALSGDMLLGHLLVLHDLHPDPVEARVRRALRGLDPQLRPRGVEATLDGIRDGVARVALAGGGCGSSLGQIQDLVEETLRAIAPELRAVESSRVAARRPAAFVPVDALLARPAPAAGGVT